MPSTHLRICHITCCGDLQEAACCCINANIVLDSGRQIKVISLILSEIRDKYLYNALPQSKEDDESSYTGATVVETVPGYYGAENDQIILLDYGSLYPNIMRSYNICPTRYVMAGSEKAIIEPGVTVQSYEINNELTVRIATPSKNPDSKPPMYTILSKLLAERTAVRKLMETETDPVKKTVLNCRQLSRKVSCNAAYGLLGSKKGYLSLPELAALITFQGRHLLDVAADIVTDKYGGTIVAGDVSCENFPA
jgi:DNA polymerase elongation subunit (family B)